VPFIIQVAARPARGENVQSARKASLVLDRTWMHIWLRNRKTAGLVVFRMCCTAGALRLHFARRRVDKLSVA